MNLKSFCKITCVVLLLCAASTLGCATTQQTRYPATVDIAQLGGEQRFPLAAAGFVRVGSMVYARDGSDYSVGYNRYDPGLVQAVTMYFYPAKAELDKQFAAEVQNVLQTHEEAVMVKNSHFAVSKAGVKLEGRIARFEYRGRFGEGEQELVSALWLTRLGSRFVKVRATTPREQARDAEANMRELMEQVAWEREPVTGKR